MSLGACDAPKREELTGLQQRLDALVAEQGELRKQTDALTEDLRKQKEAAAAQSAAQASALEAAKVELAAVQAQVTALAAKPVEPVRPVVAGRPDPTARYDVKLGDAAAEGSADAKVTIVIFSAFQCPFCVRVQDTLEELQRAYGSDLRLVAKHNPLSFHTSADGAARAAEAAGKQGKFWEMHDKLYENIKALGQSDLERYAKELGLDVAQFRRDMDDATIRARIDADIRQVAAYSQAGMAMFESAVLVASLVGTVLGLYAFTTDRRQRSIVTILCRPVHRFDYAIGKALGVVGPIAGTVIVIGGLLVAGLGILGAGIPNQLWLGLLQVTAKVTCWVCLAVAIGLHLRPGIAILCAMAFSVLPGLRNGSSPLGRSIGATVHALLPAEAPIDFAKQAFSYEVIDVDLGLHLSVVAENVLYGIGALAVSAALFARRDLDLAD